MALVFHGSNRGRKERILQNNLMEYSCGDKHWLGNGSYFYTDEYDAYSWIKKMFISNNKREPSSYDELQNEFGIISAEIEIDDSKVFDLDKKENKILLKGYTNILHAKKEYSDRYKKVKIKDGVTLNILFEKYDYMEKFDAIVATFAPKGVNYKNKDSRFEDMLEKQLCIRNLNLVNNLERYDYREKYTNLEIIFKDINSKEPVYNSNKRKDTKVFKDIFK